MECRLCVVACPVGAIGADGRFNFSACYTHNYREFLGVFSDLAKNLAESRSAKDYERKVGEADSATMWQSLSFGANYKAAYCLAACPAGEEVMEPFLNDRKAFVREVLQPLQEKRETVSVVPGSDAEAHVAKSFPHKTVKRVRSSLTPISIEGFRNGLSMTFQPGQARNLAATYHFQFSGAEPSRVTVVIADQICTVQVDLIGQPDLLVQADGATWIGFLRKQRNLLLALLTGRIRLRGNPRLLLRIARCFAD